MGTVTEFKRHKTNGEQDVVVTENSLCKLHESLLLHILSFLETKDVARTSVLSKRWKYVWTSILNLTFEFTEGSRTVFMDFLYRALLHRIIDIKEFTLNFDVINDQHDVNRWISTVVWHNVETLSLSLYNCKNLLELPSCLFTCSSVREMELCLSVTYTLKLPPLICFPNLKILHLESITFPDDHSTQKFFSGCRVVEELTINECNWENINIVNICCPKLWSLRLTDVEVDENVWNESHGCQVSIFGSCLTFFHYTGNLANEYCLYDSSILDEVWVSVDFEFPRSSIVANRLFKLLNGVSDAKTLNLKGASVVVLRYAPEVLDYIPLFKNLSRLNIIMEPIHLHEKGLLKILENSPNLKVLEFSEGITLSARYNKDRKGILEPVPTCFTSSLKRLEILFDNSYIQDNELVNAAEVLLERALVLEKFIVYLPNEVTTTLAERMDKEKLIKDLIKLPRASQVCQVEFANC